MRFVLVALAVLALAACQRAPAPATTPANQVPAPDYRTTADDELGFLPADADLVVGFNARTLMQSQLWHAFEPQVAALWRQVQQQYGGASCSDDLLKKAERVTMAVKLVDRTKMKGVIVMRGADMPHLIECSTTDVKKRGGTVTVDRGVTITTSPSAPGSASAMTLVGPNTLVTHIDASANHDSLTSVLASGTPLRNSQAFMKLYERRERGSSVWGMANGSSSMFDSLASSGMRPKSVDGTIVVTNRLVLAVRLTMGAPVEADAVAAEINKVKPMAGAYVTRLDAGVQGAVVEIQVELNENQIRSLAGMLGAIGP
ncbi:MAG TPA: hypothetical protein VIV11_25010 [Kofleriaceae bacterium]